MNTVLIADDDRAFVELLGSRISQEPMYEIVAKLSDGQRAIEQVTLLRPDILVLDLIMPGSDGMYVIDYVRNKMRDYRPVVYVLSGMGTSSIIKALNGLDVDFFSLKPVSLEVIVSNLKNVASRRGASSKPRRSVTQARTSELIEGLTTQLGIAPHRKSTICVNEALKYCVDNPDGTNLITKILYPEIAKKHGMTSSTVERNIRHAISLIQKARTSTYMRMFAYADGKKLTNSEFLAVVSEYIAINNKVR